MRAGNQVRSDPKPTSGEALVELTAGDALPVLLAGDDRDDLRALEAALAPLGLPLQVAGSGAEALALLLEGEYALILLDMRMPGLDELQTARLIKGRARTRDMPIVLLTSARDEIGDMIRGDGAVDYLIKPFDPELLRAKVAVFVELEASRRALQRSEAFLRGAFEAAPIGKTVLDGAQRIVRANPAFARLMGVEPSELHGVPIGDLCHAEDRELLSATLDEVGRGGPGRSAGERGTVDLRLTTSSGADVWVALVASSIEPTEFREPLLLIQWVDLTLRRRAEQARAELLLEQAARAQAEAMAERLGKLEAITTAIESLSLDELLPELALRLADLFEAGVAEIEVSGELGQPVIVRAAGGAVERLEQSEPSGDQRHEVPLRIERESVGVLRLALPAGRRFSATERSLMNDVADRAALAIQRARLHQEEHRIAVELQRGLLPADLPEVAGVELAASYQAAGLGAEVGGDWYDAFTLADGRVGLIVGDVTGRGIRAASAMGQLRSVTRGFALADDGRRMPGDVLSRLSRHQIALRQEELFTVVYAVIDPRAGAVWWANAGHPAPLLRTASGQTRYLEGAGSLMGIEEIRYEELHGNIGSGETLILYTDGLVERRSESLDAGLRRLAEAVAAGADDPRGLCEQIISRLVDPDSQLHDDVTVMLARVT